MAQYTQRSQPMHRHSKWLSKTFGDIGVTDPKCQTVCEQHIDPLFVKIIKQRKIFCGGEPKQKTKDPCPVPSAISKPGPSGMAENSEQSLLVEAKPGPSKTAKRGHSGKATRSSAKKTKAQSSKKPVPVEFECIPIRGASVAIKTEMSDELAALEELPTKSEKVVPQIRKSSRTATKDKVPKKRARLEVTTQPEKYPVELTTTRVITSEIMLKNDPDPSEVKLLPSVFENIPVKQEIPEPVDTSENNEIHSLYQKPYVLCDSISYNTFNAINLKEKESQSNSKFEVKIKVEEGDDCASKLIKNEQGASLQPEVNVVYVQVKEENVSLQTTDDTSNINSKPNKADFQSIDEILGDLLENKLISTTEKNILANPKLECRLLKADEQSATFNQKLKSFAISLYVSSHKAYEYVQRNYKTCLPPTSTLRDWLVQPRGHSGFSRDTLEAINAIRRPSESHKTLICLVLKDVKMTTSKAYRGPKHRGNFNNPLDWSVGTANAAIVMTAVALNANWKLPIGYFWTNVIKGSERANLVKVALSILETVGVEPVAVSFEYNNDNLQMCSELKCNIDKTDLKTSFLSESGKSIFIFPDPCGILELIYKDIDNKDSFVDGSQQVVSLTHIPLLLKNFLDFESTPPEQLLRKAIASELCKNDFNSELAPTLGTLTFLKNIHVVLDVLCCRKGGRKLKGAIPKIANVTENPAVLALQEAGKYFKSLRVKETMQSLWAIVKGRGILGLCALIDSALMMICKYSNQWSIQFGKFVGNPSYFLANLTSQGLNKRSTNVNYFQKEYKTTFQHIVPLARQKKSNLALENISVLTCTSAVDRINLTTNLPNGNNNLHVEDDLWKLLRCEIPEFEDAFVVYIARYVTYNLVSRLQCDICIRAIRFRPEKSIFDTEMLKMLRMLKTHFFMKLEDPSSTVMNICKTAEAAFRTAVKQSGGNALNPKLDVPFLLHRVMKKYVNRPLFESIVHHQFDTDPTCNHVVELARAVATVYLDTRLKHWKRNAKQKQLKTVYKMHPRPSNRQTY